MEQTKTYTYKRYMRDGTVREITGVVRTRAGVKRENALRRQKMQAKLDAA